MPDWLVTVLTIVGLTTATALAMRWLLRRFERQEVDRRARDAMPPTRRQRQGRP